MLKATSLLGREAALLLTAALAAVVLSGLVFRFAGQDPFAVFGALFRGAFGDSLGLSETLVRSVPILVCALAVAVPAWVGLINVGGEGQFHLGAIGAAAVALCIPNASSWILLPSMACAGAICGAAWSSIAGLARARWEVNEVIVTILMNFVAILLLEHLVHGPWRDSSALGWPYTAEFSDTARLPMIAGRIHVGSLVAVALVVLLSVARRRTRYGWNAAAIADNRKAARLAGIPVSKYVIVAMIVGGAIAGVAGMAEVSAVQGRLRPEISPGYGYDGFLVAWLSANRPLLILPMSVFVGGLVAGGDAIQVDLALPFSTVQILLGCMLLSFLALDAAFKEQAGGGAYG